MNGEKETVCPAITGKTTLAELEQLAGASAHSHKRVKGGRTHDRRRLKYAQNRQKHMSSALFLGAATARTMTDVLSLSEREIERGGNSLNSELRG